jgi:uncharacterized protein YciU (UPF0263 family)
MEQRSPDQLVEWAYDQFLEQAADMLAPEQIVDITLEFEQRGAVEATLPNADWSTELGEPVDMARWAEVWVGLLDHQDEFEVIYATFLLPGIRASTTCISAGTASSRHKKRRPRRLFRFALPESGACRDGLGQTAAAPAGAGIAHGQRGKLAAPAALDGSPPTRRRTPARRSPGSMGALRAIELGHAGQLGLAVHGGPLAYLGQGAATTEAEPVFGPAVTDAGTRQLIRHPARIGSHERDAVSSMTILPCL